jgi:hypothetical protein
MHPKTILIGLVSSLALANAAIVDLFADQNCETPAGSRNVYDDSCAPLGGFQSFRVTYQGGNGQYLTAYSPNNCNGGQTACISAQGDYGCHKAVNSRGGSNAMSSGHGCSGTV